MAARQAVPAVLLGVQHYLMWRRIWRVDGADEGLEPTLGVILALDHVLLAALLRSLIRVYPESRSRWEPPNKIDF